MLHDTKYIDHHLRVSIQHAPTDLTREIQQKRDEVRNLVSKAVQKKRELYALGKADKNCETLGEHHMLPLALPYLSRQKVVPKPHGTLRYVKISEIQTRCMQIQNHFVYSSLISCLFDKN